MSVITLCYSVWVKGRQIWVFQWHSLHVHINSCFKKLARPSKKFFPVHNIDWLQSQNVSIRIFNVTLTVTFLRFLGLPFYTWSFSTFTSHSLVILPRWLEIRDGIRDLVFILKMRKIPRNRGTQSDVRDWTWTCVSRYLTVTSPLHLFLSWKWEKNPRNCKVTWHDWTWTSEITSLLQLPVTCTKSLNLVLACLVSRNWNRGWQFR